MIVLRERNHYETNVNEARKWECRHVKLGGKITRLVGECCVQSLMDGHNIDQNVNKTQVESMAGRSVTKRTRAGSMAVQLKRQKNTGTRLAYNDDSDDDAGSSKVVAYKSRKSGSRGGGRMKSHVSIERRQGRDEDVDNEDGESKDESADDEKDGEDPGDTEEEEEEDGAVEDNAGGELDDHDQEASETPNEPPVGKRSNKGRDKNNGGKYITATRHDLT